MFYWYIIRYLRELCITYSHHLINKISYFKLLTDYVFLDKQKRAEKAIKEATAKLDNCVALAALEAGSPIQTIENLTQEAIQRIDTAAGGVANCIAGSETLKCFFEKVRCSP